MLIGAARSALQDAQGERRGSFHSQLTAMTFSALAIEALCNSIGERMIEAWKDFESATPNAKLRLLAARLGIEYKKDAAPWAEARRLVKFRNAIAHAKPEFVVEEKTLTEEEHNRRPSDRPESKLEKQITLGNAKRAVAAAVHIKELLCSKVPDEIALGLSVDAWSGRTSAYDDAQPVAAWGAR
jgi:hypothetical protein